MSAQIAALPVLTIVPDAHEALLVIRRWDAPDFPGQWSIWDIAPFSDETPEDAARTQYAGWGHGAYLTDPDMHVSYVVLPGHNDRAAAQVSA